MKNHLRDNAEIQDVTAFTCAPSHTHIPIYTRARVHLSYIRIDDFVKFCRECFRVLFMYKITGDIFMRNIFQQNEPTDLDLRNTIFSTR